MTVPAAGRQVPQDRYGSQRTPGRRRWGLVAAVVAITALIAAGLGLAYWLAHPSVQFGVTSFQVTGPRSVDITFQVRKMPNLVAECIVRSRDADGTEVARQTVRVPGRTDGEQVTTLTVHLSTTGTPISGEVYACRALGT